MRLIALLLAACAVAPAQAPRKAPSFTLPDVNRTLHDITDHRGKVVVLEIMQTTCPHCAAFSKVLEQIHKQYAGRVQVLAIVNPPDGPETMQQYIKTNKVTFPLLFDSGQVAYTYVLTGSISLPRVWIIDRNGMIAKDTSYTAQTKDFFEKRGIFAEIDKVLARK
jgi:peroxiredoxin